MSVSISPLPGGLLWPFRRAVLAAVLAAAWPATISAQGSSQAGTPAATNLSASSPLDRSKDEPGIREDEIRQQLAGKMMYLRNGYLDNTLHFNELGQFAGSAPRAPYTLSLIQIEKVHLSAHRLEIQGYRYGLHFLDEGANADALANADKVRITPKKKIVTITIDRARVVKPKKVKEQKHKKGSAGAATAQLAAAQSSAEISNVASPVGELSQAQANRELRTAIESVFAAGLDDRMLATLPDYWRFYFQSMASRSEFRPNDSSVLRQSAVDRKAKLISTFEPPSNDFAQTAGVAGIAAYHVVVRPDGKAGEVSVSRPIGFGLDENAVDSIRKASFEPALKDGKPVTVLLDVLVQFRIYSNRTAAVNRSVAGAETQPSAPAPSMPGPYSVKQTADAPK